VNDADKRPGDWRLKVDDDVMMMVMDDDDNDDTDVG
jgi:hypothetical protein